MARTNFNDTGPMGEPRPSPNGHPIYNVMVIDNKAYKIHTVVVHRFQMGDVEDPDLYAGEPLWQWQQSEMGKWVMERAVVTPAWYRQMDQMQYHVQYAVVAKLKDIDYTFWTLKWGNDVDK
jgi:hypothetical protein